MNRLLLLMFVFLCFSGMAQTEWVFDKGYQVRFAGDNADGSFSGLDGKVVFSPSALESAFFDVSIETRTIDTGNGMKDGHARGKSWLDAVYHPTIRFVSDSVKQTKAGFEVFGTLDLHGMQGKVTIPFTFEETETGGLFNGTFNVNRKNYGIRGNFASGIVGETFRIDLYVPVLRKD